MSSSCPFSPRMSSERGDHCCVKDCLRGVGEGCGPWERPCRGPLPKPLGRMYLPSTLQQPELAELWDLEGRWDLNRR